MCKEMQLPPRGCPQVWQASAAAAPTGVAWRESWAWEWPPSSQENIDMEVQDELLALLKYRGTSLGVGFFVKCLFSQIISSSPLMGIINFYRSKLFPLPLDGWLRSPWHLCQQEGRGAA